jgi:hypothetical protein
VPAFEPLFWDLALRSPESLLHSTKPWINALAIVRAEDDEKTGFEKVFAELVAGLAPWHGQDRMRWNNLLHFVLSWMIRRREGGEIPQLLQIARDRQPEPELQKEVDAMGQFVVQRNEDRLREKYTAIGEARALRDVLIRLLEQRFDPVEEALRKRIRESTDVERLRAALGQVLTIEKLEDLVL